MRLLAISHLHREIWRDAPMAAQSVIAGDIDAGEPVLAWAESAFTGIPVICVLGDHEGYGQKIDSPRGKIGTACTGTSNVTLRSNFIVHV